MATIADQKKELQRQILDMVLEQFRQSPPKEQEEIVRNLIWSATRAATLAQLEKWRHHVEHTWLP